MQNDTNPREPQAEMQDPDADISLLDIAQVVVSNLRLLIFAPILIGLLALGLTYLRTPTFVAKTQFLPPQQQQSAAAMMLQSLGPLGGLAGAAGLKNPAEQYVAFLESRVVADAIVERFKLMERYGAKLKQEARDALRGNTTSKVSKENIISLEIEDLDAKFAAELANGYVEELARLLSRISVTEAQQRRAFFETQLEGSKKNLIKAEQDLASTGISAATLNANPSTAFEGPARLRAQVTGQEVKLAAMRSYLANGAPELREAQAELAALQGQLRKAEQQQAPSRSGGNDYIAKYREFKYQEALFELFSRQYEVAKVDESRDAVVQVIDVAEIPERPFRQRRALIAAGAALLTGFALLVYIFIKAGLARTKRDPQSNAKLTNLKFAFARSLGRKV